LSRQGRRVLQVDCNDFYGDEDSSHSYSDLQKRCAKRVAWASLGDAETLASCDRQFSVDMTVPCILHCKGSTITELIRHGVSKYLSFLSVKTLTVRCADGYDWTIPTTRNRIFQDKKLQLSEKRSFMMLFKSALAGASSAIVSSAFTGGETLESILRPVVDPDMSAINFLQSTLKFNRHDVISGIIHGVCLHTGPTESLTARAMLDRLTLFIESLTQYEDGCPFLVPMYGISDIPQAFARTAAVSGAVYMLGCDYEKLRRELEVKNKDSKWVNQDDLREGVSVDHAVACYKINEACDVAVSLSVIPPKSFDLYPIFVLELRALQDPRISSPVVCPPGYCLVHFIREAGSSPTDMRDPLDSYLRNKDVIFTAGWKNENIVSDMFSLSGKFEAAKRMFNKVMERHIDDPLPVPSEYTDES
jgi:hypothetical protein